MAYDGSIRIDTHINGDGFQTGLKKICSAAATGLTATAAALGTLGGLAMNTGIAFESAFAGVKKTVSATPAQLDAIHDGLIAMSKDIPQTAAALSSIAEAAGQLGIKTDNIMGFTEVMANMGVATNMSSEQAATALARLANITQMPQTEFDRLGSVIVALGNNLATTESEITEMSLRIAGAGHQVGMSEDQILAFSGALSSVGIEAEAGGTAISTLISKMSLSVAQGGKELGDFASVAGMTGDKFKTAFETDASGAILSFIKGLSRVSAEGGSAIQVLDDMGLSDIRMRDAMLRAAGASGVFSDALQIGSAAWNENTALTKEAEQRYLTMDSQLGLLKNSVQALGIAFYESTDKEMGDAVALARGYVEQLSTAFGTGGLQGLVSELGTVFAEVAVHVSGAAPAMMTAASEMLQSFITGIQKNLPQLADAALEIVSALVKGIADIFPRKIAEPVKDAMDAIAKSFRSGGLRDALNTFRNLIEKVGDVVGTVAKVALPVFTKAIDTLGRSMGVLVPLIVAAVAAITTWKIAQQAKTWVDLATTAIKAFAAANKKAAIESVASTAKLGLSQLAYGLLTGKIGLATAAQTIFNSVLNANLIGLVVTAIAALVAGFVALTLATANQKTEAEKALETANARIKSAQDEKQAFYDLCAAQAEVAAASLAEIDSTERLAGKLQALTSETGFVDDANRGMAEFILGELNEALGTEYSMRDGQIDQYQTLQSEIWKTIDAKRAEALLAANEPIYLDAIKNRAQAQKDAAADYIAISQTKAEMANLEKQHIQDLTFMDGIRTLGAKASSEQILALQSKEKEGWYVNLLELQKTMDGQQLAYDENASKIKLYNDSIKSYDDATAASQNKNFAQCESLLSQQSQNYEDAKNNVVRTSEETMRAKGEEYAVNLIALAQYLQNCKDGNAEYDAQYFETLRANAKLSYQEAEKTGAALVDGQITGIDGKKIDLNATIEALRENGVDIMRSGTSQWWALGEDAGMGYANGLASTYDHIMATAASILNVGKNLGAKAPKSSGPVRRDSGARSVVANGRTSGMESSNSPTAPPEGEMAAFSAGTAATGVSSDTTSTATGVSSGFGAAGIRAIPHLSAAQTASINAQMRAAVFAQQNAVAARVSAQAEYQIVQHQSRFSESLAPALGNQIAGAVAAAMPKEIKTQTSIVLDGRAVFQGVKKAEANYGYNVGGLQNEW